MDVTVLGTGAIGSGMARSLLREGHAVTVWNRTTERARPLADVGARVADDLADAVTCAEVVVVIVFDLDAVLDVLPRFAPALRDDAVVVCSATVGTGIDAVVERARSFGVRLVDAPVLGNAGPAERGELSVMAAADPALRSAVGPVLDAIGAKVTWVADAPGAASRVKLACNAWVSTLNAAMSQAVGVAHGLGVDPVHFFTVVGGTAADSPYLGYKRDIALGTADDVITPVDDIRKDSGLIRDAAHAASLPTVLVDAVDRVYADLAATGRGRDDMATLSGLLGTPTAAPA